MAYQFNTNLPHMAQQLDGIAMWQNGKKLADEWLDRQKKAELAKIQKQTQDIDDSGTRFEQMIGLAKQSKRSKWLLDDIHAMQLAQRQAELKSREKMAGINKTMSETNKNNATATETMQKVGGGRMGALRPAYEILASTGQTAQAMKYLDYARASGAIDDDTYQAVADEWQSWADLSPDETKALGFAYAKGTLDPKYLYQTADNQADNFVKEQNNIRDNDTRIHTNALDNQTRLQTNALDNETSRVNNQNTVNAQMYGHDVSRQNNIDSNQTERIKAEQQLAMKQGEVDQIMTGTDGNSYIIYKDGRVELAMEGVALGNGAGQSQQITNKAEEKKRIERLAMTMQEAEGLIDQSTGSMIGNLIDWGGRAVGYSTDGAKAIAQLKALSGQLVALQPKMSGPQSDKDVQLYREMAGDLANPNLPRAERLQALQIIKALNEKYANHANVDISQWHNGGGGAGIQTQNNPFF